MEEALTISEIKRLQLNILIDIHKFCLQNNIKYSLAYGTLLGAIRHKGYIPWDDDIDIWMNRSDYNKFMKLYNSKRYKQVYKYKETEIRLPFGKVLDSETILEENANHSVSKGLYVDIFPLDIVDSKKYKRKKKYYEYWYKLKTIKEIRYSYNRSLYRNMLLCILKALILPIGYKQILTKLTQKIEQHNGDGFIFLTDYNDYNNNLEFNKDIFNRITEKTFEGHKFLIFEDYNKVLQQCYGDYMSLPPIDKQVTHHDYKAFLKSK